MEIDTIGFNKKVHVNQFYILSSFLSQFICRNCQGYFQNKKEFCETVSTTRPTSLLNKYTYG